MTLEELDKLADAWIRYHLMPKKSPERNANFWAVDLYELEYHDPETLWLLILAILRKDSSMRIKGPLSAGPVENLLAFHGPQFIDRVELTARQDPTFAHMLGGVWPGRLKTEVWDRLHSVAIGEGWDTDTQDPSNEPPSNEALPDTKYTPVIRTDFEDDATWRNICDLIRQPTRNVLGREFYAYVDFVENPRLSGIGERALLKMVPSGYSHTFLFVVDRAAAKQPEFPILVMDLYDERGRIFRTIPSEVCAIQNNLSISNLDFCDFADAIDSDGVFRGFKKP